MKTQELTLNDIKKYLYKNKPIAALKNVTADGIWYSCDIEISTTTYEVLFCVPLNEIGDTIFERQMPAQLLNRYINTL
jgi:hypothetical protein